ncbi:ABC-2 type transport system ATP-binding protein/lipopolysaccharide transport system ATP-binding protein [Eubacterium limosum]|nr:ABC-2 type transport system ATP-binding protein/lipopolysaccharide transport system ATP-binding protein [Eubacterium limosum]
MNEKIIQVNNVSMKFNMSNEKFDGIKEYFIKLIKHELYFKEFTALNNVSVDINRGDVFGIVGLNGSGKSTLLKVISGILKPSSGSVQVQGSISPLIELGAGFDMNLTATENVMLNGLVLGYSKQQMLDKMEEIIEFSELQPFMDVAVKNFSSGMIARLGFAIATSVQPEILIVDEILSVGDFLFQQKCEKRMNEMMAGGTTVLIVSHSIEQIERLCTRVMWLDKGNVIMIGGTKEVCDAYKRERK